MYAVVLVGGFGTRLRPLTNDTPKPMLPVVNRPMIVRLVERLALAGVSDVVLALGFKPELFAEAFPGDRCGNVVIHYAVELSPLDTAGAIAFAARSVGIGDTFLVANGDVITDLDYRELIESHRCLGVDVTVHLTPVDDPSAFGVVELVEGGLVRRFVEKPEPGETDSDLINAGTYVIEPSVLDLIPPGQKVSVERETFQILIAQSRLAGFATSDYWIDAGRPEFYLKANLDLINGSREQVEMGVAPGALVDQNATVYQSVVADGVEVATGAHVSKSVLLPGAQVEAGAVVESSCIAGRVCSNAIVRGCVIGGGFVVDASSVVVDERLPQPD